MYDAFVANSLIYHTAVPFSCCHLAVSLAVKSTTEPWTGFIDLDITFVLFPSQFGS